MSARPEDVMTQPDEHKDEYKKEPSPEEQDDDSFLQWLALVVLLACWLAEAYM